MSPKDANMLAEMKSQKMLTRTPSDPGNKWKSQKDGTKRPRSIQLRFLAPSSGRCIQNAADFVCLWYPNMPKQPIVNRHYLVAAHLTTFLVLTINGLGISVSTSGSQTAGSLLFNLIGLLYPNPRFLIPSSSLIV
jgi:hypothetical protein